MKINADKNMTCSHCGDKLVLFLGRLVHISPMKDGGSTRGLVLCKDRTGIVWPAEAVPEGVVHIDDEDKADMQEVREGNKAYKQRRVERLMVLGTLVGIAAYCVGVRHEIHMNRVTAIGLMCRSTIIGCFMIVMGGYWYLMKGREISGR